MDKALDKKSRNNQSKNTKDRYRDRREHNRDHNRHRDEERSRDKERKKEKLRVELQSTLLKEESLTKTKQERLKRKAEDVSEITSWLCKAARVSKNFDKEDNVGEESDDETVVAGVKILYGLDKVVEGRSVVLTLKDQTILVAGDINEGIDMLENVEIGEQRRRDNAYKAATRGNLYEEAFDDQVEDEGVTLEGAEQKLEGGSISRAFEDLYSAAKSTSGHYTRDEMLLFKKPKKKKFLRKKKNKLDLDTLEREAITDGFGSGDLGSRKNSKGLLAKEEAARIESEMRSNAYQSALAEAEEASKVLRGDDDIVFGEDYDDVEESLEEARKLTLKRKEEDAPSGPKAVALLAAAKKEQEDTQGSTVVITEMDEFVLGLQRKEKTPKPESEDVCINDDDDIAKPVEHEIEVDVVAPDEIIHEAAVGKGLSGALKLLKDRGSLKECIEWDGRYMDKKNSVDVKRKYRILCYNFHGKGPGKTKQEKSQYQEDLKTKRMKASDTLLLAMERMREAQAQLKSPYIVLSGHVKPRAS